MSEISRIERLTDEERRCGLPKDCNAYQVHAKALRIIDQLTAALEAAERDAVTNAETADEYAADYKALQAEVTRLTAELEAENVRFKALAERLELGCIESTAAKTAAEAELANAKARVAELEHGVQCDCSPDYLWECSVPRCPAKKDSK